LSLDLQLVAATRALLARARTASRALAIVDAARKDAFLVEVIRLLGDRVDAICAANDGDVKNAENAGRNAAFIDRLRLTPARLAGVAASVGEIRSLADPVGEIVGGGLRPNGLEVRQVRIPLGVIGIVYESRPNVTIDAGVLAIKAGNAVVLRGGTDAAQSNIALLNVLRDALASVGLPIDAAQAPAGEGHAGIEALVSQAGGLDLVIPRGGTALIDAVNRWARVPVVQHYQGVCHIYVHGDADIAAAVAIAVNAKAQRPGVCNAMEALLVDSAAPPEAIVRLVAALVAAGVEVRACARSREALAAAGATSTIVAATDDDRGREFLDMICLCQIVDGVDGAIDHITRYGSGHTEAILCRDIATSRRFVAAIDASCVLVNASTRFNDGGELGLGAEIGISTTKLHAYGPMGLRSLTTARYVVLGDGHVRS
jgi:glutamate-5-semialdehyde dehydrogenase